MELLTIMFRISKNRVFDTCADKIPSKATVLNVNIFSDNPLTGDKLFK